MRNNSVKVILGILLFVAVIVGIIYFTNKNSTPETITIAEFGELFIYAPLYVAQEKGFFEQNGLNVTIVPAGGTDKAFAAVVGGSAEFGVADPMIVPISGEKGQPGKVIAGMLRGAPFWGVTKDSNISIIKNPSQLVGYRIGTTPSPSTAFTLQTKMFQEAGLEPNIVQLASGTCLAAMDKGEVDICVELEPSVSIAVSQGAHVVYALSDYYPTFALTGIFTLPEYIDEHPEIAESVVNSIQDSLDYIQEHPAETADLLAKRFPNVPHNVAVEAVNRLIEQGVFPTDTTVSREGWDIASQIRVDVGNLKEKPSYDEYVITRFS